MMFSSESLAPSPELAQCSSDVGFHYTALEDLHLDDRLEDMLVKFEAEQSDRGIRTIIARVLAA